METREVEATDVAMTAASEEIEQLNHRISEKTTEWEQAKAETKRFQGLFNKKVDEWSRLTMQLSERGRAPHRGGSSSRDGNRIKEKGPDDPGEGDDENSGNDEALLRPEPDNNNGCVNCVRLRKRVGVLQDRVRELVGIQDSLSAQTWEFGARKRHCT